MSTHSAECIPHICFRSRNFKARTLDECECRGRTLIRKTSLLRKINPMMRRSSFTNKGYLQPAHRHDGRAPKYPGDSDWFSANCFADPNSDRSPLYDVINPACVSRRTAHAKRCSRGRNVRSPRSDGCRSLRELRRAHFVFCLASATRSQRQSVVEPDGIEPTTSCLQSTRSPS